MKKRLCSFLLVLVMAISLLPTAAFAAGGDYDVDIVATRFDTVQYNKKDTMKLDFMMKTSNGAKIRGIQTALLAIDSSKYAVLQVVEGTVYDRTSIVSTESIVTKDYSYKKYYDADNDISVTAKNTFLSSGTTLLMTFEADFGANDVSLTESTSMMSILLGLKEGADWASLPSDSIRFATAAEANTFNATGAVTVNPSSGSQLIYRPKDESSDTLTVTPTFASDSTFSFAKAAPSITTNPTASAITYGQTLADSTLTGGTASVEGSWSWETSTTAPQVSDSNTTEYTVVFTPTDTSGYTTATCKVKLTVAPKTVTDPTFEGVGASYSYTGGEIKPTFTLKDGTTEIPASEYEVAYSDNTAVGNATITVTDKIGGNYTVSGTKTFAISAASTSITIADPGTITYDGSAVEVGAGKDLTYTYTGDGIVSVKWYSDNSGTKGSDLSEAPKNAGTYWLGVSATASTNYGAVAEQYKQFTISPKSISGATISLGTQETYNGSEQSVVISSVMDGTTTLNKDTDYEITSGGTATNVESKTLKIEGKGNYTGTATVTWSLQKATPVVGDFTVTAPGTETYDGTAKTVAAPTTTKNGMGAVKVYYAGTSGTTYTKSETAPTNAGTYTVTFAVAEGTNYKATTTSFNIGELKINKADQTINVPTEVSVSFGHTLNLNTVCSSNATGATLTFAVKSTSTAPTGTTLSGSTVTAGNTAGTFTVTVNAAATDNYNAATEKEFTVKVVNLPAASVTTAPTANPLTYNGTEQALVTVGAAQNGTMQYRLGTAGTYSTSIPAAKDAGTYTVYYKVVGDGTNYSDSAEQSVSVTIAPKTLTKDDLTYTGTTTKVYDGNTTAPSGLSVSVKAASLCGSDTLSVTGTLAYNSKNVADANKVTFTPNAITTGNYSLATTETLDITANITAKSVTVSGITATDRAYNGTNTVALTGGTVSDVVSGDTVTVDLTNATGTIADIDASTTAKTVTITGVALVGADKGNYALSAQPTGVTVTISKVTYGNQTATGSAKYGATGTVDLAGYIVTGGTASFFSAADSTNVLNGTPSVANGKLSFTFKDNATVDATANIVCKVTSTNYEDYQINVNVKVLDKTSPDYTAPTAKTGLVYNGTAQTLVNAGTVPTGCTMQYSLTSGSDYSTSIPAAKDADTYTVYYKVVGNEDYADVAEQSVTVTVAKRVISVKANDKSMTVNGTLPTFDVTYGNFASGDSEAAVIDTKATASCTADGKTTGSFPITVSETTTLKSGMDTNYTVGTPTNGTLTVNSAYSGGGGGGGVSTYTITVEDAKNGDVTVSPKNASKGDTVTITVAPEKGYTLETLTVLDKNGKEVDLTNKGSGKYTFKMPASKVTVKATFAEDNSMLNFFVDVPASEYYYDAVKWAVENGITTGINETEFGPDLGCTRAQIVTFLWRAAGCPEPKGESHFSDVSADAYYAKAVAWAVENGITKGMSDTEFAPDATCTRAQSVTFLYRAAGNPAVSSAAAFSDVGTDAYYANAVAWAAKEGITGGIGGGLFGSDNDCTRAQIVTFLYRSIVK